MVAELQAGATLSGGEHSYRLQRELGRGGFGVTFLAERVGDDLQVALKSLHIGRLSEWKSLELFEREIAVLDRLDHARIPDYVDHFALGDDPEAPEGLVLVQEFVAGFPLSEVVSGKRSIDEGELISWLVQILEVLEYLHHLSPPVIHRDITPKNILIRDDGVAFLVDFGSVQAAMRSAHSVASTAAGTFGYAPMEQFVSAAFPASDMYGLAMTCLAVGSGREPSDMPFSGVRVDVRQLVDFDARVMLLLERMTEPDPQRRLGDARIALEQLRPLATRLSGAEVTAGAMQRVAEVYRTERAPVDRTRVESDDLLPSERVREAGQRLELLAGRALALPPLQREVAAVDSARVSAAGSILGIDNSVIDVQRMTEIARLPQSQRIVAMTPAADVLLAYDEDAWNKESLTAFHRRDGAYVAGKVIKTQGGDEIAIHPDGRSFAHLYEGELHLHDVGEGTLTQRIKGHFTSVAFRGDGQVIGLWDNQRDRIRLLHADGRDETVPGTSRGFAFGPDGRMAAVMRERGVRFGSLEELVAGKGTTVRTGDHSWRRPCFSPDGHFFAALDYSNDLVRVIDIAAGKQILTLHNPGRPRERVRCVSDIGFSADSRRLLVACDTHYNRFDDEDEDCVAIWTLPDGRYLGALLRDDDDRNPVAVAASGYYGRLPKSAESARPPRANPRWHRPEIARRALLGEPVDELLDEFARAQLADVEERWAYVRDLVTSGTLDPEADLLSMVRASRGLTHVLDVVVREAREAQSKQQTFGGGQKKTPALTSDQFVNAAKALAARPAEELALIHEDQVAAAERAERARAEELTPGGRARRGQSSLARRPRSAPPAPRPRPSSPPARRSASASPSRRDSGNQPLMVGMVAAAVIAVVGAVLFLLLG